MIFSPLAHTEYLKQTSQLEDGISHQWWWEDLPITWWDPILASDGIPRDDIGHGAVSAAIKLPDNNSIGPLCTSQRTGTLVTLSLCHLVSVSPCLCVSLSLFHHVSVSPCLCVALSLCLLVSVSSCLCVTLSLCRFVRSTIFFLSVTLWVTLCVTLTLCHNINLVSWAWCVSLSILRGKSLYICVMETFVFVSCSLPMCIFQTNYSLQKHLCCVTLLVCALHLLSLACSFDTKSLI